ncbi:glycosyltransferase family 2 protein [Xylanivirga thermophila]|uniref:glycosyltransferase family 2 protein n=1 Tax=Xylanivirga thermophila TaxID=2496273 RepID=UPI00101DD64B|nr:glycosyltransferase family 2 protein [Xylanivirga thermophila]
MIVGGIVLYNPNIGILKENIKSIYSQVYRLVLIDNNSNIEIRNEVIKLIRLYENIRIIQNDKNEGIAKALNQVMEFAESINAEWAITLDQDSVCPPNLIATYEKYTNLADVAIITPVIIDRNDRTRDYNTSYDHQEIERCITSAALNNIKVWRNVGKFDEKMFIDFVDFEYSYRVREYGYKILRINKINLLHRLGDLKIKYIGKKKICVGNHNALRKYYYVKNACYCHRRHKILYPAKSMIFDICKLTIKIILYENEKKQKLRHVVKGIKDGLVIPINR